MPRGRPKGSRNRKPKPATVPKDRPRTHTATGGSGADLTPEELEFAKAVERYKREKRRPFPTCSEVLSVLLSLGYRKPGG